jgi:hypothetical protein
MLYSCPPPRARAGVGPNASCLYPLPSACPAVKHPHNQHVHAEDEDEYRKHSQRGEQRGTQHKNAGQDPHNPAEERLEPQDGAIREDQRRPPSTQGRDT